MMTTGSIYSYFYHEDKDDEDGNLLLCVMERVASLRNVASDILFWSYIFLYLPHVCMEKREFG